MTIYGTLLARGYFPKELPPAFFTEQFSRYARTKVGRLQLQQYKPADNFTECVSYRLALPGGGRRQLQIPHPASFSALAQVTAKHFRRLLQKAGRSKFAKSRPVFGYGGHRALRTLFKPSSLARERAGTRAGGSYLLKVDVNQFYPGLYTHAIAWAVDSRLRLRANWQKRQALGNQLDLAVRNLQGKVSQGVPIGNDISFLLGELVLCQIDRALGVETDRAYRWVDDYEFTCDSREEAEALLTKITKELARFKLRLNHRKSRIVALPQPASQQWQERLLAESKEPFHRAESVVRFFDAAFLLREEYPEAPVMLYALGLLFRIRQPHVAVSKLLHSGITQAVLCEPGSAQKAFALLSYWHMNGFELDRALLSRTIDHIVVRHRAGGVTTDVAWALSFCLEQQLPLSAAAGRMLADCDDDCIALQALHCHADGLISKGFATKRMSSRLKQADLDGEHWLLAYEAVRQGFLAASATAVAANPLFAELLKYKVTFYRTKLPSYASVIHPGGAPEWAVEAWLDTLRGTKPAARKDWTPEDSAVLKAIQDDIRLLPDAPRSHGDVVVNLLDVFEPSSFKTLLGGMESYFG